MSYIGNVPTTAAFPFDQFSGTGAQVAFTLSQAPASTTSIAVTVSGVVQNPNTYSVSGATLTFTEAPPTGTDNIGVLFLGLPAIVGIPSDGVVTPAMLSTGAPTWDSNGNVGIGTDSPVSAAGFTTTQVSGSTGGRLIFESTGIPSLRGIVNSSSALVFYDYTAGAERIRIDSSGNLLVGTTSGGAQTNITATSAKNVMNLRNYDNAGRGIAFLNPSGVGVGSITWNASATSFTTSSDYRLKDTIAPMTGALDKVALLKPCTYKWKVDGSDGQGFIAHELDEVVPGCVTGEKDAVDSEGNPQYQGIDTSFLVATLTAAIQELKAELDAIKTEVAALK